VLTFLAASEAETESFAAALAGVLVPGDVVALVGDLGAGKTRLVQGLARVWGVPAPDVTSPTFTLIHEYAGRIPLRHCDAFRLRRPDEFADLGLDELFAEDGVALVEWADRVAEYLPRDHLRIEIAATGATTRLIAVSGTGPHSREIVERLRAALTESRS
jgi:tRNA threonylcarbamoyladenosine biosynthesis protein TsaE